MSDATQETVTARTLQRWLTKHYDASEWAFFLEVPTKQGTRRCDALAVNLWSSRGHVVHGMEIKVTRSDWLRELKDPQKSDEIMTYCHLWSVVAPKGIVREEELPPNWGLIEVSDKGVRQKVKRKAQRAKPLDANILIPILRRSKAPEIEAHAMNAEAWQREYEKRRNEEQQQEIERGVQYELSKMVPDELARELASIVRGSFLRHMPPDRIKAIVMIATELSDTGSLAQRIESIASALNRTAQNVRECIAANNENKEWRKG